MTAHRSPLVIAALLCALPAQETHRFHRDHVLGTSLDAEFGGPDATATRAFETLLAEIERLRRLLSSYDEKSELRRLASDGRLAAASPELRDVLTLCAFWHERSAGAFDARVGGLLELWKGAQGTGRLPEAAALENARRALAASSWSVDAGSGKVTLHGDVKLALDSVAKSYVLERALAKVRAEHGGLERGMVAIGGDIVTFGKTPWRIGVADPAHPADNARGLGVLTTSDAAIATSAGYARGFDIGGVHYSHIVDPRTGRPANGIASATVVAPLPTTAGPLATTLCVLTVEEGLALVAATKGAECLLVDPKGEHHASPGFARLFTRAPQVAPAAHEKGAWPDGTELRVRMTLPEVKSRGYRRPYVAVWVENGEQRHVRTITVWGNERRWLREMTHWTEASGWNGSELAATTRATRAPGEYTVVWNGRDDAGKAVAPGEYIVCIEVAREHGGHTITRRAISCGGAPVKLPIPKNAELAGGDVEFGPRRGGS